MQIDRVMGEVGKLIDQGLLQRENAQQSRTPATAIAQALQAKNVGPVAADPSGKAQREYDYATQPPEVVRQGIAMLPKSVQPVAEFFAPSRADLLTMGATKLGTLAARAAGMTKPATGMMRELITYHGTPHTFPPTPDNPLGAFDATKIGTGEGAQEYSRGLYLSEAPQVAETYTGTRRAGMMRVAGGMEYAIPEQALSELSALTPPQKTSDSFKEGFQAYVNNVVSPDIEDRPAPSAIAQTVLENAWRYADDEEAYRQGVMEAIRQAEPILQKAYQVGSLYTVDLPDAMIGRMLDWDTPLSKQSSEIQAAIGKLMGKTISQDPALGKLTGEEIYAALMRRTSEPGASERALRNMGIPGVKYLDAGSRGKNGGTRNFVVFPGEEQNLKILKRE